MISGCGAVGSALPWGVLADVRDYSPEEHVAKYESEGMARMDDIKNSKGQRNEQIEIL